MTTITRKVFTEYGRNPLPQTVSFTLTDEIKNLLYVTYVSAKHNELNQIEVYKDIDLTARFTQDIPAGCGVDVTPVTSFSVLGNGHVCLNIRPKNGPRLQSAFADLGSIHTIDNWAEQRFWFRRNLEGVSRSWGSLPKEIKVFIDEGTFNKIHHLRGIVKENNLRLISVPIDYEYLTIGFVQTDEGRVEPGLTEIYENVLRIKFNANDGGWSGYLEIPLVEIYAFFSDEEEDEVTDELDDDDEEEDDYYFEEEEDYKDYED